MTTPMPAIFFGHGNPMNAVLKNAYTDGWAAIGSSIPQPKAVLCISAHWYLSRYRGYRDVVPANDSRLWRLSPRAL
jgi:aromatic ring-opening dioxygenase catalytic subunit (LigB family)